MINNYVLITLDNSVLHIRSWNHELKYTEVYAVKIILDDICIEQIFTSQIIE